MERIRGDRTLRVVAVLVALGVLLTAFLAPTVLRDTFIASSAPIENATDQTTQSLAGSSAAAAANLGYTYLLSSGDHEYPARWCRGTEIGYTIDFSQARAVGLDPMREQARWGRVFQDWERAVGGAYTFRYLGEARLGTVLKDGSHEIDIEAIESGRIGITYVHGDVEDANGATEYLASATAGRTAGNGGLQVVSRGTRDDSALVGDRGFVMIDASDAVGLAPNGLRHTLYTHEAGHALGLGHVEDTGSLMHGTLSQSRLQLGLGDVTGIKDLASMPCSQ